MMATVLVPLHRQFGPVLVVCRGDVFACMHTVILMRLRCPGMNAGHQNCQRGEQGENIAHEGQLAESPVSNQRQR